MANEINPAAFILIQFEYPVRHPLRFSTINEICSSPYGICSEPTNQGASTAQHSVVAITSKELQSTHATYISKSHKNNRLQVIMFT